MSDELLEHVKNRTPGISPPKSALSSIFSLLISMAKKSSMFFDSFLSLTSHLQSVSKFYCFFLQNIFKIWPLFSSTLVQVTILSLGFLPSSWFPCFYPGYLQFIFNPAATEKKISVRWVTSLYKIRHWFPISLTVNTKALTMAPQLPTSFPTALSLAQSLWPCCCSSNIPDRLLSQDLPLIIPST